MRALPAQLGAYGNSTKRRIMLAEGVRQHKSSAERETGGGREHDFQLVCLNHGSCTYLPSCVATAV